MRVADLRQRVGERIAQVAASRDEENAVRVLDYARLMLIALVPYGPDEEVDLEKLTVGTGTAARILRMHPEYVRGLVRGNNLRATKEAGEFRIPLVEVLLFLEGKRAPPSWTREMLERRTAALWQYPPFKPQAGGQPA